MEMADPGPWVVNLAKTSPFTVSMLAVYERSVGDILKSRWGITDPKIRETLVRAGVEIALRENRELGYDHIRRTKHG